MRTGADGSGSDAPAASGTTPNGCRAGDTTPTGQKPEVYSFPEMIDKLRPLYQAALKKAQADSSPEKKKGVGLALGMLAGMAMVLFNPLTTRGQLGSVSGNLVPDKAYRMDDYRGMSPDLGSLFRGADRSGERALSAPALAKLRKLPSGCPGGRDELGPA